MIRRGLWKPNLPSIKKLHIYILCILKKECADLSSLRSSVDAEASMLKMTHSTLAISNLLFWTFLILNTQYKKWSFIQLSHMKVQKYSKYYYIFYSKHIVLLLEDIKNRMNWKWIWRWPSWVFYISKQRLGAKTILRLRVENEWHRREISRYSPRPGYQWMGCLFLLH